VCVCVCVYSRKQIALGADVKSWRSGTKTLKGDEERTLEGEKNPLPVLAQWRALLDALYGLRIPLHVSSLRS
jgi:hypothetical protein